MVAISVIKTKTCDGECPSHRPRLSFFIYVLTLVAVIGGFLFGYDTGIVSSAFIYVPESPDLTPVSNNWKEYIIAVTPGMAGLSALFAGHFSNVYGRWRTIVVSSIIFAVGALVCAIGISKYLLLFGRFLLGIAIGVASMVVPVYVGESAPAHIRGRLVFGFQFMIVFGQMASNIIAYGFSFISAYTIGWRLMFGFAAVPAFFQLIGFFFLPESPRWLYSNRGQKEAEKVLDKIYNGDKAWIAYEMREIQAARKQELNEQKIYGKGNIMYRILTTPSLRRALMVGCALQIFQQLSGINTIMYYTSTIIRSAGVRDGQMTILISVGTSSMNFIFSLVPFYLIDKLGRRKLLLTSVVGVILSLLMLSGSFLLINLQSAKANIPSRNVSFGQNVENAATTYEDCANHTNCDFCVTNEYCGFCGYQDENSDSKGYCYPANKNSPDSLSAFGQCATNSSNNSRDEFNVAGMRYEWSKSFCNSSYTFLPISIVFIYLCFHSIGFGPMPWVLNAEFYPLYARSTCASITTFCNWTFNLIVSVTFLRLMVTASKHGAFLIYAIITTFALIYFIFYVPETKGRELDEIGLLFMTKQERQALTSTGTHDDSALEIPRLSR